MTLLNQELTNKVQKIYGQFKEFIKDFQFKEEWLQEAYKGVRYYEMMPDSTIETFKNYLINGYPMGSFCNAVVKNNLILSLQRADTNNRVGLAWTANFVFERFPDIAKDPDLWLALHAKHKKETQTSKEES